MKSLIALLLLVTVALLGICIPETVYAEAVIPITAPSAVLLDGASNRLIYAKNSQLPLAPASTTKILTAILAVENLKLDQVVTIPKFAEFIEPSNIDLQEGERFRAADLIRATLINSANDAAEVLGAVIAGSKTEFSEMMNRKARAIGCRNSHFVRASGLPATNQYSTAYDMARVMQEAERYPFIVQIMKTKTMSIASLGGRRIFLKNHNKMLFRGHDEIIGKTGWTRSARHCFVGQIGLGKNIVVAMLGSHSLWRDLLTLVKYKFGWAFVKTKKNDRAWAVTDKKKIQTALFRAKFFKGPINGKLGPLTIRAIKRFQAAHGLKRTGIVESDTWLKLRQYL